jgi:hypothetical protein
MLQFSTRIGQGGKSHGKCCGNKRYQDDVHESNIIENGIALESGLWFNCFQLDFYWYIV